MSTVIKVENLSKQYRLGLVGSGTFKEDTKKWWAKIRGKENPYAFEGEENNRSIKGGSDYVWSLKDINFEVQQGDVLGIVGRNGAGKSTLLKILSKVTAPTTGTIKAKGRIASLLEVGTGFHPELTGRENIFLNGAILGMKRHEIIRKLDEIIAFAGIERYIDTPVKRYSSGMYVRLAFAVAAHLENEILIIDEVLAVGDAEFQKKCIGKMGEVSQSEGRTVLFVSHNSAAIRSLCKTALLLKNGKIQKHGDIVEVLNLYGGLSDIQSGVFNFTDFDKNDILQVHNVTLYDAKTDLQTGVFKHGSSISVVITIFVKEDIINPHFWMTIGKSEYSFTSASNMMDGMNVSILKSGKHQISCDFFDLPLFTGVYFIYFGARDSSGLGGICESKEIARFSVESLPSDYNMNGSLSDITSKEFPPTLIDYKWGEALDQNMKYSQKIKSI